MKVILHADDFGYDKDTIESTIELLDKGYLTSASIMANMPCTKEACEYACSHPEMSFGVHLTYVDELTPCCKPNDIPSLVNQEGKFLMANEIFKRALTFRLGVTDIIKESLAQIRTVEGYGINVSHLDSHGHYHKYPSFQMALGTISKISRIDRFRRAQNVFVKKQPFGPKSILRSIFDKGIVTRFNTTDFFYMSANGFCTEWADAICQQMDQLPEDATIEIGVHPGAHSKGGEAYRKNEYHDIISFVEKLKNTRHQIINWNNI